MPNQVTSSGQPDGKAQAYPMAQDHDDNTPVVNIPPGAVPPQIMAAPHPEDTRLTELVTDGRKEIVTQSELIRRAQKGGSADNRYQEAAAKSKETEAAIAFKADMDLLAETGDVGAFRRAGASMGLTGDEVEEAARIVYESMDDDKEASPGKDQFNENDLYEPKQAPGEQGSMVQRMAFLEAELAKTKALLTGTGRTGFSDLDPALQTVVVDVEQRRVNKIIQNALDSDEVIAYYMKSYDEKGQQAIRDMLDEKVRGRLDASDGSFGDGTRIMREVIPEVKATLEALGTPNRLTPQMGFGPSPGGQGANIYPTKRPDHVSSTEAGFEEHIAEMLQHNMFKATQGD